jgi:hypothetical protein
VQQKAVVRLSTLTIEQRLRNPECDQLSVERQRASGRREVGRRRRLFQQADFQAPINPSASRHNR